MPSLPNLPKQTQTRPVIGILGNIGAHKGAEILVELSRRLAADGSADLVVIGDLDPAYALAAPAQVHGAYQLADIPGLVARYGLTCWLIPSIWPETFTYVTHEAVATGLLVICFDLGAQRDVVLGAGGQGGIVGLRQGRPDWVALRRLVQQSITGPRNTGPGRILAPAKAAK